MKKRILHVDDEPEWRSLVSLTLASGGHEVLSAADATEALRLTEGVNLGLMLLDINLGGESGLTLMKYLRRNQPGVPILLYSGCEHDEAAIVAMRQQGASQYLRKGPMDELVAAVRRSFRF